MSKAMQYRFPHKQKGMVLVMVLMIFAFAAIVSSEIAYQSHREVRRSANIIHQNELLLLAKGGEAFAIQKLLADFAYDKQSGLKADYLSEVWAVESEPFEISQSTTLGQPLDDSDFVVDSVLEEQEGIEQGDVTIVIEDLHARFNLNNVRFENSGHLKGYQQFENMLNVVLTQEEQSPGMDDFDSVNSSVSAPGDIDEANNAISISDLNLDYSTSDMVRAVLDWVDDNDESFLATGAEDDFYEGRNPAYRTANQDMFHVSELKAVKGFNQQDFMVINKLMPKRFVQQQEGETADDSLQYASNASGVAVTQPTSNEIVFGGVKHYITALPFPSTINVNTAPAEVLRILFTQVEAQSIVAGRELSPYQNVDDIFLNLTEIKTEQRGNYTPYLTVQSEYFEATIIAKIDETQLTLRSTLYRDKKGQIKVLARDYSGT